MQQPCSSLSSLPPLSHLQHQNHSALKPSPPAPSPLTCSITTRRGATNPARATHNALREGSMYWAPQAGTLVMLYSSLAYLEAGPYNAAAAGGGVHHMLYSSLAYLEAGPYSAAAA